MSLLEKIESGDPTTLTVLAVIGVVIVLAILINRLRTHGRKPASTAFSASDADYAADDSGTDVDEPMAVSTLSDTEDETETVAAIMAALSVIMGDTGFRLRSIRRTGRSAPAWNLSGRDEYLATRL